MTLSKVFSSCLAICLAVGGWWLAGLVVQMLVGTLSEVVTPGAVMPKKICRRLRLPLAGAYYCMCWSSYIVSEPRAFSAA